MSGPIQELLGDGHARLDALLARGDAGAYAEFRAGLLRHIGMEEKILLPAAQRARGGEALPVAARLRLDHGAIAALLVPTPTPAIVAALRDILTRHNRIEEGPDGLYAACERVVGPELPELVAALGAAPAVPVSAHVDGPKVMAAVGRALERGGYRLADYDAAR
jgi:hypothetical protein